MLVDSDVYHKPCPNLDRVPFCLHLLRRKGQVHPQTEALASVTRMMEKGDSVAGNSNIYRSNYMVLLITFWL